MTKYHPDTRFITDFAAGSLPLSQALCVTAHLHYCDDCKHKVAQLSELGSTLLDELPPLQLKQDFSSLMARIDSLPEENVHVQSSSLDAAGSSLPAALNKITNNDLDSLHWQELSLLRVKHR